MKAAIYRSIEKIEICEVPKPICKNDGVVIKVEACAICGSDVRTYFKGTSYVHPNTIIGHEVVGTVEEVGSEVDGICLGERLAIGPIIPCGECFYCRRGLQHLCQFEEDFGGKYPGGFAEYMYINSKAIKLGSVSKIPKNLSFNEGTLAEPLSSVIKAHELANTKLGDTVVVIGAGPVGCMHVEMARIRGAQKIIQTEVSSKRIEMSKRFGADVIINAITEEPIARIMKETDNFGANLVICASPSVEIARDALKMVCRGGTVLLFAGFPKDKPTVEIDGNLVHYNDICVLGTIGFTPRHFHMSIELISKRIIDPKKYITGILPLEKVAEGIEKVSRGEELKLVIVP